MSFWVTFCGIVRPGWVVAVVWESQGVRRDAEEGLRALLQGFGKGGVGVDGLREVADGGGHFDGEGGLGDQFARSVTGHEDAEQAFVVGIHHHLGDTGRLVDAERPPRGAPVVTDNFDGVADRFEGFLVESPLFTRILVMGEWLVGSVTQIAERTQLCEAGIT